MAAADITLHGQYKKKESSEVFVLTGREVLCYFGLFSRCDEVHHYQEAYAER